MAVGDIYRLAVIGLGPTAQLLVNVHHYRETINLSGSSTGENLIGAWRSDVESAHAACLSTGVSIVKYEARNLTQLGLGFDETPSPVIAGTIPGDSSPPTAPTIITWRTGLFGRRFRGRTYMWPTGESEIGGGQITGVFALTCSTFASAALNITDSVLGDTFEKVVHSTLIATNPPVIAFTVQEFLGRMGSRRQGVGA